MTVYLRCAVNLCFEFADCLKVLWFASEGINDFRPVPAEGSDAERILKNVQNDSAIDVPR